MTYYSRPITMPKTKRDGLANFVQMIINSIEAGDHREALLKAADLHQDITSGVYNDAMTDHAETKAAHAAMAEAAQKHAADLIAAHAAGVAEGIAKQKAEFAVRLGLAA